MEISQIKKKNIPKLDFCKGTPIEPRKRVVRVVGPNFGTPGFGATFCAKKCYFWPIKSTFSCPNFKKTHVSFKNIIIHHSQKIGAANTQKWPEITVFGPKMLFFAIFSIDFPKISRSGKCCLFLNNWSVFIKFGAEKVGENGKKKHFFV